MNGQQLTRTILILSANPRGTDPLRLDTEVREIKEAIQRSRYRDRFVIEHRLAVRPMDVQRAMLDCRPQIVHFCGHGGSEYGLVLENETGKVKHISTQALADLFDLFADRVECVLLNACYSEVQAQAIVQHINAVIGMNQPIGDQAAIEFARSFYDALGAGDPVAFAFRLGKNGMQLAGVSGEQTPVLLQKPGSTESVATSASPSVVSAPVVEAAPAVSGGGRSHIFISYKRGVSPDETVALEVFKALSEHHDVFIDQTMPVGTLWAERIEAELRRSDFLITFLTQGSVNSEMVKGEIETAHHLGKQHGRPIILPVRLAYREPFAYPLSAYLNGINWAFWDNPADTARLVHELMQAIAGGTLSINTERSKAELTTVASSPISNSESSIPLPLPFAQPPSLEMPEGTMDPESQFYVERPADAIALNAIGRQGVTITIKGPRQMGKSSLLIQIVDAAIKANKRVAFLDFQLLDGTALTHADTFFRQFCNWLSDQLELPNRVDEYWGTGLGNNQRCTSYLESYVLKELGSPLLLAMDEVDRMFETAFQSDFFSMLRSWHNSRALPMKRIWRNLNLALVTATEPYHLIENLNQSPFNVGEVITLTDFTPAQVADLNGRHSSPFDPNQERQLMDWLNGHPYLVRKAFYLVASQQFTVEDLFAGAIADQGPFGDHLRYHLFRISDRPDLIQGLRQVIQNQTCADARILRLLSAAGLVYQDSQRVIPRCRLYADYFRERLHG
ncbi:AAA-like domain-containing protein [Cyanobacteria bacterium FACHB-471]|nr:AAA-like domain-containing protein [Cyanobacteria bacterium FACHB-471]